MVGAAKVLLLLELNSLGATQYMQLYIDVFLMVRGLVTQYMQLYID